VEAGLEPAMPEKAMFIQTETTPNPATLKFIPGRTVLDSGTMEFTSREAAARSPLAEKLFGVPGVTGVFYGYDFVTVTKDDSDWQHLKPAILGAIMEHYMSGAPLFADGSTGGEASDHDGEFFNDEDAETVATIKDLIETRVRPAVANDGGDITFRGFKDGIVYLNMKGSCAGCPSSTATLQHGIQNLLRHFVPDVVEVRPM
jgi:Fe-S cluster biogenesis protein NfuA